MRFAFIDAWKTWPCLISTYTNLCSHEAGFRIDRGSKSDR